MRITWTTLPGFQKHGGGKKKIPRRVYEARRGYTNIPRQKERKGALQLGKYPLEKKEAE